MILIAELEQLGSISLSPHRPQRPSPVRLIRAQRFRVVSASLTTPESSLIRTSPLILEFGWRSDRTPFLGDMAM